MRSMGAEALYEYNADGITFVSKTARQLRTTYFPLCGVEATGIKSSITPFLSGDIKIDKEHYVTKPASTEDLRQGLREVFVILKNGRVCALGQGAEVSVDQVEAGPYWHCLTRTFKEVGLEISALNFVPVSGETVELMRVTLRNVSDTPLTLTPTTAIPLFARALANKHDHEHVTSLLHRITQTSQGVCVAPTMLFDESGHLPQDQVYFVYGATTQGQAPAGSFPTVKSFYGNAGIFTEPQAIVERQACVSLSAVELNGQEAMGALQFAPQTLAPQDQVEILLVMGMAASDKHVDVVWQAFNTSEKFEAALEAVKNFWHEKTHAIAFQTGDVAFNGWLHWVTTQPVLRRIFGCSFLPDHDYGKGGKGWRDIWQDLLSLILIEPESVRDVLINNFAGVRIDGSNATIIGARPGEFVADRNAITRVWSDHGVWPFLTLQLYVNQTGDYDILLEKNIYFRDPQLSRSFKKDEQWSPREGHELKDVHNQPYQGTLIEHILVQHLVQFFNVGEHNILRLESADWNDGLDMAFDRGESVPFMSQYAGNLQGLAALLEALATVQGIESLEVAKELLILLDHVGDKPCDYAQVDRKQALLFDEYCPAVQPTISGQKVTVTIADLVKDLQAKATWMIDHIRAQEKISVKGDEWFNGYYDNKGRRVEGLINGQVHMTLTGQVFPIMGGVATPEDITSVTKSVRHYLKDPELGGFRLNTDFGRPHYLDLGRAFGFAFGTKENGAFFSHMIVMYAYALYSRGFAQEGHEALMSIYAMCRDTDKSKIYPGVPEYMDAQGKGMYHYLTGAASWWVLTELTQVFGVRGQGGDLVLEPKLVVADFGEAMQVAVTCQFAGKIVTVRYENTARLDYGQYCLRSVKLNKQPIARMIILEETVMIPREIITQVKGSEIVLLVELG